MRVALYGQASRQPDGKIFHQMIEVEALHPISYYLGYKYFYGRVTTQAERKGSVCSDRPMPVEHLVP